MKTFTNSIAVGVIALAISSVGFSAGMPNLTSGAAMSGGNNAMMPLSMPQFQACKFQKYKNSFVGSWVTAFRHTKQLTTDQAKIVAEAAVILYGDSTMQVGTVTAVPGNNGQQNYQVQITNTAGKVLSTVMMNGRNGKIMNPIQQQAAPVVQPTATQS